MNAEDRYVPQPEMASEYDPHFAHREGVWGINTLAVLTRLTRGKWLIGKTAAIACVVGAVASLLLPASYKATTTILTPQQTPSVAGLMMNPMGSAGGGQLAMAAAGGLGLRNPNDVYLGLLGSRPVADAIIQQFGLRGVYGAKDMTAARRKLAANTIVASEKSTFISVSVTDHDRQRAAAIANAYTEQLRILTKTLALTEASHRRMFYEDQLKHAKEDVVAAEVTFRQIEQKKGLVQLDAQAKATIGLLSALHAQVSAKQVELQALRSYSTEQNPEVQLTERQLRSLQEEVSGLEQKDPHDQSGNHDEQAQQSHVASGSAGLGMQDVAGAGLDYLRAEHELQYRQVLFDLLLKQYDVARLDEAKDAAVVQVVEAAIAPDRRSSPGRLFITLIVTLLGVAGACACLLAADFSQKNPGLARSLAEFSSVLFSR